MCDISTTQHGVNWNKYIHTLYMYNNSLMFNVKLNWYYFFHILIVYEFKCEQQLFSSLLGKQSFMFQCGLTLSSLLIGGYVIMTNVCKLRRLKSCFLISILFTLFSCLFCFCCSAFAWSVHLFRSLQVLNTNSTDFFYFSQQLSSIHIPFPEQRQQLSVSVLCYWLITTITQLDFISRLRKR